MLRRWFLILPLLWPAVAPAASVVDATGRGVSVPDAIARVAPAGPPAALLLEAVAPDLMLGWPSSLSEAARALLAPSASGLPQIPRLTGREDVIDKLAALKPDLILDYGTVSPRYSDLARATQERTGIPTILLDGTLAEIPHAFRILGGVLHRAARAETLANFAEALLALPAADAAHPRVLCARGADGLTVVAPGTELVEIFTRLGWQVVAPNGQGASRQASLETIAALDPDIIVFADPAMRTTLAQSTAWQALRAVRAGHAVVAPNLPFGWVDEPPSINRLLGFAWLTGRDPVTLAASFNAVVYGRVLAPPELEALLAGTHPLQP